MPQPFSPQSKVPHPGLICIFSDGRFTVAVTDKAGKITSIADSPQFSKPQVSLPQPVSLRAVTVPNEDVADKPERLTSTLS